MNKKLISRILAVLLAGASVFALSACNTGDDGGTGTGTGTENSGSTENKDPNGEGGGGLVKPVDPVIPTVPAGAVKITKAAGDLESCYAIWDKVDGSMGYNVYCKADGGEFVKLDAPLVREYKDYCRADAVGLKAGKYTLKVVPTGGAEYTEDNDKAATATDITVLAHDRSGYAFVNGTSSGAYNEDGTLKANANVVYVTNDNKDTVELGGLTGIQNILQVQKKATAPLSVRFIGNVTAPAVPDTSFNSYDKSLQIKENAQGITLEGIGSDATANGWTIRMVSSVNVEVRNLGVMNTQCREPDGISIEKGDHIWVHNCDIFYGGSGSDNDQAKGDGALDTKLASYVTHSYNHFWDCGKCNLQGMKQESTSNYITYHHNWYDHSDSRHPRIRTCTVHVYNNYFDGNAKYGVGATTGASVFVENNYFRSTVKMKPMLVSSQGTDAKGEGTFSGESGAIIKAYGNKFDGSYSLVTQNDTSDKSDIDCYLASSRDEVIPAEYKAATGTKSNEGAGNPYNNFDTAADFYKYEVDSPEGAKEKVERYAGRVDGGDFKWEFTDAEDSNYGVIAALKTALGKYSSDLVKVGGEVINNTPSSGGNGGNGGEEGGDTGATVPEGVSKVEFIAANAGNYPAGITVSGNYKDGKGYLKMESATKVTVRVEKDTVITVHATGASKKIKLNSNIVTLDGKGEYQITVKAGETLTIEKGDSTELEYILLN